MIKVSVFYPAGDGKSFDVDYYCTKHMPMVQRLCGPACTSIAVDAGLGGGAPGSPATYAAIGHLVFDSVEAFQNSFGPHASEIMADIPNYTTIEPLIQISEIKL
jgi:uncharacterized protein (TIGR02118 family)